MDNQPPLVSIIMPVYNRELYLQRAINSVLKQTYQNWELVVIDDGSRDYSPFIVEEFAIISDKINLIVQEHSNLPSAKNNGIRNSQGKYITFLDSDDEYKEDHLELRIQYMNKNPDVDLIHGGVEIIGNKYVPDRNNPDKLIHLSQCFIGATFFGKRNVFIDSGGFRNVFYSEDSEFIDRVINKFNIRKVNFPTYVYHRENSDTITNRIKSKI